MKKNAVHFILALETVALIIPHTSVQGFHIASVEHTQHEVDSPNLSTVVLAICGRSASDLKLLENSGHPPNMVTSVNPGPRLKAAALCKIRDWRLGTSTCIIMTRDT